MKSPTPFRTYRDPLEAEELIEILQKHNIPFERSFEKSADLDDYVGSHPFDTNIVISVSPELIEKANQLYQRLKL